MNKFIKHLTLTILTGAVAVSCYKDQSTEATFSIPEIKVTGLDDRIEVVYGQELSLKAEVSQEGRTADDFTYLWEIDFQTDSPNNRLELADTPELTYKVSNTPSDKPYNLSLKVTDNITGLTAISWSKVYVSSSLGEGLLIAYTRDGGKTSEFDIVADPVLTYGYTGTTRYTRELYSLANEGAVLDGKVLSLSEIACSNGSTLNENKIIAGTDAHILSIDPLTFKKTAEDKALFNSVNETSFKTTAQFNFGGYSSCAVVNGTLYGIVDIIDNVYSKVAYAKSPSSIFTTRNFGYYALDQGFAVVFNEYDSKFYYVYGWALMNGALTEYGGDFTKNYSGAAAYGGGCLKGKKPSLFLKTASGEWVICAFDPTNSDIVTEEYNVDGTDMDNLVSVAFCDNSDLMYYATADKIYSVIISGGKATVSALSWKPDSEDEKITGIRQYTQGWYGTHQYYLDSYEFQLPYNRLQILITTYNEKTGEGKVYMRPFNISTGRFTMKSNGTLSGFGEITAIAPTFK